ncbi:cytochrome c1 [Aureococcus anophagefferens]|nr:cytochrome c1 [Aureococcus anophagefferens]
MFERPGKLSDPMPGPYANEEAARAANNGALPPDLSLIVKARHGGADYIFSLLSGYCDAPEGKVMLPGLYYNPYFAGGAIGMPAPLMDEQMAKDVAVFLSWAAEPEHDDRKKAGFRWLVALSLAAVVAGWTKRCRWSILKARKISYEF